MVHDVLGHGAAVAAVLFTTERLPRHASVRECAHTFAFGVLLIRILISFNICCFCRCRTQTEKKKNPARG